jgi:hypothetical protein
MYVGNYFYTLEDNMDKVFKMFAEDFVYDNDEFVRVTDLSAKMVIVLGM